MLGDLQAFVLAEAWLGPPPPVDRDAALAELARRYLRGHAPADARDLSRWAGLPLGDARRGLAQIDDELVPALDGLLALADGASPAPLPPPRLMGPFDPVLLGWTSRADVVGEHGSLVTDNGIFRAFAMVDGRAVGTWSYAGRRVQTTFLEPVGADVAAALHGCSSCSPTTPSSSRAWSASTPRSWPRPSTPTPTTSTTPRAPPSPSSASSWRP
jgi:hypothetical protein